MALSCSRDGAACESPSPSRTPITRALAAAAPPAAAARSIPARVHPWCSAGVIVAPFPAARKRRSAAAATALALALALASVGCGGGAPDRAAPPAAPPGTAPQPREGLRTPSAAAWSPAAVLRRLDRRRLRVGTRVVRIDRSTLT